MVANIVYIVYIWRKLGSKFYANTKDVHVTNVSIKYFKPIYLYCTKG